MKNRFKLFAGLMLVGVPIAVWAAMPLAKFEVLAYDPGILVDRSWGKIDPDTTLPWKDNKEGIFYIRPIDGSWTSAVSSIAKALQSEQVPGLDFTGQKNMTDAKLASLLAPTKMNQSIRFLRLGGTQVSNQSVALLAQLKNLEVITLGDRMTNAALIGLKGLPLQEVIAGKAKITDEGVAALAGVKTLRRLDVGETSVSGKGLYALRKIPLDQLRAGRGVDNRAMAVITRMHALGQLDLTNSRVTDEGLSKINSLTVLHTLFLPGTISNKGLSYLDKMDSIRRLDLSQTKITDEGLAALATLTNLEELSVGGTAITDASITALLKLSKLRTLDLAGTRLTESGINKLSGGKSIQVLAFTPPGSLQLSDLKSLRSLTQLRTLVINGKPVGTPVLAYLGSSSASKGYGLAFDQGRGALSESTPLESLPVAPLTSKPFRLAGLRQIHSVESDLDHVVPAVQTARIDFQEDTEDNFMGEFEVKAGKIDVKRPSKKSKPNRI